MPYHDTQRNTRGKSSTPIYIGQRVIGVVSGDTLHKSILGSKHKLKRPPAICSDRSVLRDAAAAGATRIEVLDRETGFVYSATLATFDEHSFPVMRGGDQVGLHLDHWSINGNAPAAKQRIAESNQERAKLQLSLFGEVAQ
jgi:hypothetical protein